MSKEQKMQELLESLYDDLTEAARSTNRIYKAAKEPQDYFSHEFKLRHDVRDVFGKKYISLEEVLKLWIPRWKREGRLKYNPTRVLLNKEEGRILETEAGEVLLPYLYCIMMNLFLPL
jgi:hypothetical protein